MESSVGSELIWTEPDTHKAKETYQANVSSAAWGLHDCSFLNRNKMPLFCNLRCLKNPDELRDFLSAVVGFPGGSSGKEHACQCRKHKRHRFNPWVGKIPWRRAWQPTLVFLPGESRDRGAWQAIVHRVTESQTWLKRLSMHVWTFYILFSY